MARSLRSTAAGVIAPAHRAWDRVPIRVQGRITVVLPLVAVLISAVLATTGNYQRIAIETDIQRKFELTAALGDLSSSMVNAETGMRGYLLTGQGEFLEPFDRTAHDLPDATGRLLALAAAEPDDDTRARKTSRIRLLQSLTDRQMGDLAYQRGRVASAGSVAVDPEMRRHLLYGKELMDGIRSEVAGMQAEERTELDGRIRDINAISNRDYASVILALVVALATRFLAWYLFRRGVLRRVERLTENVRSVRDGRPAPFPLPAKRDAMGELEREVTDAVPIGPAQER